MKLFQKLVCMAFDGDSNSIPFYFRFLPQTIPLTQPQTPTITLQPLMRTPTVPRIITAAKILWIIRFPNSPYGVLSTTQTGVMEKLRLPRPTADCRRFGFRCLRCG